MYASVVLRVFTLVLPSPLFPSSFISPNRNSERMKQYYVLLTLLQSVVTSHLLSVAMNLGVFCSGYFLSLDPTPCVPGCLHLRSIHIGHVSELRSFSRLSNIPMCTSRTMLCVSIHPSTDTWDVSNILATVIKLLWTPLHKYPSPCFWFFCVFS